MKYPTPPRKQEMLELNILYSIIARDKSKRKEVKWGRRNGLEARVWTLLVR